jgi:hypothetical protein
VVSRGRGSHARYQPILPFHHVGQSIDLHIKLRAEMEQDIDVIIIIITIIIIIIIISSSPFMFCVEM